MSLSPGLQFRRNCQYTFASAYASKLAENAPNHCFCVVLCYITQLPARNLHLPYNCTHLLESFGRNVSQPLCFFSKMILQAGKPNMGDIMHMELQHVKSFWKVCCFTQPSCLFTCRKNPHILMFIFGGTVLFRLNVLHS